MENIQICGFDDLHKKHRFEITEDSFTLLWHYTSVNGLTGIVRKDPKEHGKLHFWFTRSDCLNDPSEGVHALDLFRGICDRLYEQNEIDQSFYEFVKDAKIPDAQLINFPIPPQDGFDHESVLDCVPCDAFICSFSLEPDSLDMWRYYSKGDGGYGLQCCPFVFDELKDYEYSDYEETRKFSMIRSYKVIYNSNEKEQILKAVILDTFTAYQNSNEPENEKKIQARQFIQYALKVFQFQFKHECYATEQEYRFVFYRPRTKPEELKNELPDVRFRCQNGIVVPYIDVTIEKKYAYLGKVLISPFVEDPCAETTTRYYLEQCGFKCDVKKSELPVRI